MLLVWEMCSVANSVELPYSNLRRAFLSQFPELKIKARLKVDVLFFTLRKSRKHFALEEQVASLKEHLILRTVKCIFLQFFPSENTFLQVGCVLN